MVRSTIKNAMKPNIYGVYLKIMLNHVQLIVITASFEMQWPESLSFFFEQTGQAASATDNIISFDCFMDTRDPDSFDPYSNNPPEKEFRLYFK